MQPERARLRSRWWSPRHRDVRRCRSSLTSHRPSMRHGARPQEQRYLGRSHAAWDPPEHRPNPVDLLEEQATTRVPELVPIRYGRMLVSPFAFYRGGAYLMASDLARTPRSGLTVQLCGDAHLSNFGGFASPERRLVFDINDFDETLPGPWEWDVKRLAASFEIAGRDRGFSEAERRSRGAELGRCVPRVDAQVRRHAEHGRLVRAPRRRDDACPRSSASWDPSRRSRSKRAPPKPGQGTA